MSKDTIKNKMMRALLRIMESPDAAVSQRLEASALLLKARELSKSQGRTGARKQPKLVAPFISVLGTR